MSFRATAQDVFEIGDCRVVLNLTEIEGVPAVGDVVRIAGELGRIVELGKNSTDGNAVSTRACLTGRTVAPYGAIGVTWVDAPVGVLRMKRIVGITSV